VMLMRGTLKWPPNHSYPAKPRLPGRGFQPFKNPCEGKHIRAARKNATLHQSARPPSLSGECLRSSMIAIIAGPALSVK
jgi:hypothetical protein